MAQGSVLGPDLWNNLYDDILKIKLPNDSKLIDFADDLAARILAQNEDEARAKVALVSTLVENWVKKNWAKMSCPTERNGGTHQTESSPRYVQIADRGP